MKGVKTCESDLIFDVSSKEFEQTGVNYFSKTGHLKRHIRLI